MDKFAEVIGRLAETVGVQAERLWPQIVYVYWLRSAVELVMLPLLIVLFLSVGRRLVFKGLEFPRTGHFSEFSDRAMARLIPGVILCVAGAVSIFILLVTLIGNVTAVISPEAAFVLDRLPK